MPKIETSENLLYSLCGKKYTDDELITILETAKAELDDHVDTTLKIELNDTNRPDLWSACGIARALNSYQSGKIKSYDFFSSKKVTKDSANRAVINHETCLNVRDFSIGFGAKGVVITDEILIALIQSQEKLCSNFGRKRKTIALGIYRSDLINYPVHYVGVDPDSTKFIPLGLSEELSLREICEKHPKGREYGHIVKEKLLYPYLCDDKKEALSFPPIINSASIGAVEVGDSDLFIELSGSIIDDLLLAASILACDLSDLGFEILPIKTTLAKETKYGKEITVPYYFQEEVTCDVSLAEKMLGISLTNDEIITALSKTGLVASVENKVIKVRVPEYRNDFLHAADVVEDIMIGYGLNNFEPVLPDDFTKGYLSSAEEYARKVKKILVGLGFQEMMYNYLGSKREYVDNMFISDEKVVFIANPMSENYEVVRPSILPSLLESESISGHAQYPHNIFEIGKVCYKDENDNSGTTTKNHLGFFSSNNQIGYNEASSYVQTLLYFLNKEYSLAEVEGDGRFIPGRAAKIIIDNETVGIFGEVHPQVLTAWGSTMPAIMAELDLDKMHN